jgi:hypothetical protein
MRKCCFNQHKCIDFQRAKLEPWRGAMFGLLIVYFSIRIDLLYKSVSSKNKFAIQINTRSAKQSHVGPTPE